MREEDNIHGRFSKGKNSKKTSQVSHKSLSMRGNGDPRPNLCAIKHVYSSSPFSKSKRLLPSSYYYINDVLIELRHLNCHHILSSVDRSCVDIC